MASLDQNTEDSFSEGTMVSPKLDCPHINPLLADMNIIGKLSESLELLTPSSIQGKCQICSESVENWLCIECGEYFCSRYRNGHMADHCSYLDHKCALSLSDASVWCYKCDSYIYSKPIRHLTLAFGSIKHPGKFVDVDFDEEIVNTHRYANQILNYIHFTKDMLIENMKMKKYKKICFLTGAGISVAAGIPDFRTPGTGLYSKVAALGLPKPELIFHLEFFKSQPEIFYSLAGSLLINNDAIKPVRAHHFIKKCADEGVLLKCFTQNIDGLELSAGLDDSYLIQAHGHMRTARCCVCHKEVDIKTFHRYLSEEKVYFCQESGCTSGIIKPDVVFFGEGLPVEFNTNAMMLLHADLVFVMGTSLKVQPFASLLSLVQSSAPIVLLNRDNPGLERSNFLFLDGEIEENITDISNQLGWNFS